MKKLILFLTTITFCSTASAQLNKGRIMLGGSFNTQNTKNASRDTSNNSDRQNSQKYNSYAVSIRCGYFISDGFMLGVLGGYNTAVSQGSNSYTFPGTQNLTSSYKSITSGFSGGAFARYYKMLGKSHFALFGELAALYGGGKTKTTSKENGMPNTSPYAQGKSVTFSAVLRPGLTYFFTNTIAAEAYFGNVGYHYLKTDQGDGNAPVSSSATTSGLVSRLDFSLSTVSLGINFYFGGRNKRV